MQPKTWFLVKKTLEKYQIEADIFLEPVGRNTCAAIYLAAQFCDENDNLLIMPSDHFIPDKKFISDISIIEKLLAPNQWVTLGIKPTIPSEAYGYIRVTKDDKSIPKKLSNLLKNPLKKLLQNL